MSGAPAEVSNSWFQVYTRQRFFPPNLASVCEPGQRGSISNKEVFMKALKVWQALASAFVVGMILVVIPPIYKDYHPQPPLAIIALFDFIERLGDAVLIAVVIGGGIERILGKKEFRDHLLESSVDIFGRMLPKELREGIKSYLEISIIRTRWDIVYEIEEWPGKPGYLKLDTQIKYDMQNRSDESADYPFKYEVEDSLCPDIAETAITYIRLHEERYDPNEQLAKL